MKEQKEMIKNETIVTKNRQKEAFLLSLEGGESIIDSAKAAGVSRVTAWRWRNNEEFREKVLLILDSRTQVVEDALYATATKGNVIAQIFWLKNRSKDRWKDKQDIDIKHSGEIDTKMKYILEMEEGELDKFIEAFIERKARIDTGVDRKEEKGN